MFDSILIANRGEIACRIMATCRRLGIASIAVYSDADADALHVRTADRAVRIGPAEAAASYLNVAAIIDAALATGAAAIHPGYGFLSEKTELVEACAAQGIGWIGPSPRCIEQMGSKLEAKRIAIDHGVTCLPGYNGDDQSLERLEAEAEAIGFPLLIKASAGGGGRGMRKVTVPSELRPALDSARKEAAAAFGDDRVLLERLLLRPRHLEVQIAGDKQGDLIHLFERECSVQRNFQKVLEEAPAPNLHPTVRQKLLDNAVRLGRAIGYDSLGTVEFLLDADDPRGAEAEPYFLEMNTRLQVEHPVTEMVVGRDLVEMQIRIATGAPIGIEQAAVAVSGSAIEARICAEAPAANYAPSVGSLSYYREPPANATLRCDSGVTTGSEVTPFYDSMLSKLIAWAPERETAVKQLQAALGAYAICGVDTNIAFLRDVVAEERFREGNLSTDFLPTAFPDGWRAPDLDAAWYAAAAIGEIRAREHRSTETTNATWRSLGGFRVTAGAGAGGRSFLSVAPEEGDAVDVILSNAGGRRSVSIGDAEFSWKDSADANAFWVDTPTGRRPFIAVAPGCGEVQLWSEGQQTLFTVLGQAERAAARAQRGSQAGGDSIVARTPGMIAAVHVAEGQIVAQGDAIVTLEAMKLMQTLAAPCAGRVMALPTFGRTVAKGEVLVTFEPQPEEAKD